MQLECLPKYTTLIPGTVKTVDILKNSYQKNYIALSDECFEALKQLRQFNFEKIYHHPRLKKESSKIAVSFRLLFNWLLQDIKENGLKSYLWRTFISNKSQPYIDSTSEEEQVIDYISGMTDSFFISSVEKFMLPRKIEWSTGGF